MKKNFYALTALGRDHVGIISAVAGHLAGLGINIEDSSMARLKNEFAMILLLSSASPLSLDEDFSGDLKKLLPGIAFSLKALNSGETRDIPPPSRVFSIKIYGADRVGIVARITKILSSLGVNILDMRTHLIEKSASRGTRSLYILIMDAVPPARLKPAVLEKKLKSAARGMGVSAELSEYEPAEL